jgi:hypothetical protein
MPFRFLCEECGALLLEVPDLKPLDYEGKDTPGIEKFIRQSIGVECRFCGHKLQPRPMTVDVYPDPTNLQNRRKEGEIGSSVGSQKRPSSERPEENLLSYNSQKTSGLTGHRETRCSEKTGEQSLLRPDPTPLSEK